MLFNRQSSLIFLNTSAREDMNINHNTLNTRLNAQRRITNIRSLFAEDSSQQLLFRSNWRFAFRCNFTDQNIASFNLSTDINNTGLIQITQSIFTNVRNITCDFFLTQLCIASHNFKFFNMKRCKDIITRNSFREQNRVFIVQTIPRHKGDQNVFTQRQFAHVRALSVSHNIAGLNFIADFNQRNLVNAGILVRSTELLQTININTGISSMFVL